MSISTIVLLIILIAVGIKYVLKEDKRLDERAVGLGPVTVIKRLDGNLVVVKLSDDSEVALQLDKYSSGDFKEPIILHQNLFLKLAYNQYSWELVSTAQKNKELSQEIAKYKRL